MGFIWVFLSLASNNKVIDVRSSNYVNSYSMQSHNFIDDRQSQTSLAKMHIKDEILTSSVS